MNFDASLQRIESDITADNSDEACIHLHGIIFLFPREVFLREKLAALYLKLQNPLMAGRYAYLVENKTPELKAACELFESDNDKDLLKLFYLITEDFKNSKDNVIGTTAEKPLRELQEKAKQQKISEGWRELPFDFFEESSAQNDSDEKQTEWFVWGCMLSIIVTMILAIIGFFRVIELLNHF